MFNLLEEHVFNLIVTVTFSVFHKFSLDLKTLEFCSEFSFNGNFLPKIAWNFSSFDFMKSYSQFWDV